ncbi:TAP42-like protein [Coniochaeta ligniaria NRRL 30616]|uniref:TAP42-like protein n=1 Tax=Coniochaeta ligniaria NRRL 30616 TaxID=1408157 RepID=A0A1J7IW64_9PEZI|nr:TAP42-like protein [Coniochaeta ligniaria NRRL 30616]
MDDQPKSLKALFAEAEAKRLALESTYETNTPSYRDDVSSTVQLYNDCLEQISRLSLFSPNETAEDISTSDLPYLLVNYHLAELTQKMPTPTLQARRTLLSSARDAYERFLHQLDHYILLSDDYRKLLERYTESPTTFSTISTGADATARRDAKIANLKTEKELRTKLDFLRRRPEYGTEEGFGDEEAVRAVHLAHLDYAAHMVFQGLESLNRELDVLSQAPDPLIPSNSTVAQDEDTRRRTRQDEGFSERLDSTATMSLASMDGPLLSGQGKPLRPFTLLGNRAEIAKGVFRPGHNLPTMTIDEYLEEEKRRGGIIEGGGEASGRRPEPDEDNYEKADAETYKARQWDEFTEANPRGSGNTLNRG